MSKRYGIIINFLIAEAIDLHQYSKIPNLFDDLKEKGPFKRGRFTNG